MLLLILQELKSNGKVLDMMLLVVVGNFAAYHTTGTM
jgi:hypothetical protein